MVRKKKRSLKRIAVIFLLLIVIASLAYKTIVSPENSHIPEKDYVKGLINSIKSVSDSVGNRTTIALPLKKAPGPFAYRSFDKLSSSNAILIRLKDHNILKQKNSEDKIYPASLTKMMTVIVAIENLTDLNRKIKLANSMFQGLNKEGASMAGFQPDERVRAIDLLYGVMLPSGAECCIGLADYIAGSERNFVKLMNQKAAALGMDNTHFKNTTGLHNEDHYTTVKDLAVLLSYALQNDIFREIFTSSRHSTQPTNNHPDGITFYSTMFVELKNQGIFGGEILGGKTGYTDEAGLCLASLAKVGRQEYILITTGAEGDHQTEQYNITDALAVYNSLGK